MPQGLPVGVAFNLAICVLMLPTIWSIEKLAGPG
jgi:hypothetical protein